MIRISNNVAISEDEIEFKAVRAQGPGGQNVNKVSTAIHLFFDIHLSSLPDFYKTKLLAHKSHLITENGCVIIKSQSSRSQEQNKETAIQLLIGLIRSVTKPVKKRRATKPTLSSRKKRLESKSQKSNVKKLRKRVFPSQD